MKFRWICGNCGFDEITTEDIQVVPLRFQQHVRKDDYSCMRRDAFFVEIVDD